MRKWRIYFIRNGSNGTRSHENNLFWLLGWAKHFLGDSHINLYEYGEFCDTIHLGALSIDKETINGVEMLVLRDAETGFVYGEENTNNAKSLEWWEKI